jgi:geranylgeranyl pyrophosphate synthase
VPIVVKHQLKLADRQCRIVELYVSLLGTIKAKELAQDMLREAHDALTPFGSRASRLHELADFIVERKS